MSADDVKTEMDASTSSPSSTRMRWTDEMRAIFHEAVLHFRKYDLGEPTPQKILNYMREAARHRRVKDPDSFFRLSRTHVSSHLQKYRQRNKLQRQKPHWSERDLKPRLPSDAWSPEIRRLIDEAAAHVGGAEVSEHWAARIQAIAQTKAEDPTTREVLSRITLEDLTNCLKRRPDTQQLAIVLKSLVGLLQQSHRSDDVANAVSLKNMIEHLSGTEASSVLLTHTTAEQQAIQLDESHVEPPTETTTSFKVARDLLTLVFPACERRPDYLIGLSALQQSKLLRTLAENILRTANDVGTLTS